MAHTLRIGNGAGFWGDNGDAPVELARSGRLNVLTLEYLAELTMAILSHLRSKNPNAGFATDFLETLPRLVSLWTDATPFAVVTNAGGLNPRSCAQASAGVLAAGGFNDAPLATISGDDILPSLSGWVQDGQTFPHMETGEPIASVLDRLICANAYMGAQEIANAYGQGARVIITGRVADASLTLGPAASALNWRWDDWSRLAGGSTAGHLIECGAQVTGGLWHRWEEIDYASIGYPIAELHDDGSSIITKSAGSGGLVTPANVAEQLAYEIDDPSCYRTPDVNVDLTTVELLDAGPDRVRVQGATGKPPGDHWKVSAVYRDGWAASGMVAFVGQRAEQKARAAGQIVIDRVRRAGFELADSFIECLGAGDIAPGVVAPASPPWEVVLRITVRDPRKPAVERFCRELAPLVLAGPPGIAGYATGRPSPRPAFGYWPTLIARDLVRPVWEVRPARDWLTS